MQSNENRPDGTDPARSIEAFSAPTWVALLPVSVIAVGSAEQPIERLLALQSVIAKGVHMATAVGQRRPRLRPHGLLRLRFR